MTIRERIRRLRRLGFWGLLIYVVLIVVSLIGIALDRSPAGRRLLEILERGRSS